MAEVQLVDRLVARQAMHDAVTRDLIGPGSSHEEIAEAPLQRYIAGLLYPTVQGVPAPLEGITIADEDDDDEGGSADPAVSLSNVQYPSSVGVSFAVDPEVAELTVTVESARYIEIEEDEGWRREPVGPISFELAMNEVGESRSHLAEGLVLYARVRDAKDSGRSVTVVILNDLTAEAFAKDEHTFFQVRMEIAPKAGGDSSPFVARPGSLDIGDADLETNELLYRDTPEFAVGHGCAAEWDVDPGNPARSNRIYATFAPSYDVELMESNPEIPNERLGFDRLSDPTNLDLIPDLISFVEGYSSWIGERRLDALNLDPDLQRTAGRHLDDCEEAKERITAGINVLGSDKAALRAFRLANEAMAEQMDRSSRRAGLEVDRGSYRWRPFQLAFILLAIPSIVDPGIEDRKLAELLWFPTGGGKTEAYLGLFAFTVFLRRIKSGGAGGVTAIMRYTLRLLTTQQFERAARVVCACDQVRKREGDLGSEPISLGLFVGRAATPNKLDDARSALTKLRASNPVPTGNPCQLTECPWCGHAMDHQSYVIRTNPRRLSIECRNKDCAFVDGLPVFVVDEDLYRARPSLVIGTVDKFAALPWRPQVGGLFNLESDDPPPELIIQDELHLISGPLGTLTGLYETAIDYLCESAGVRPKVIASTATIRRARDQSTGLFARKIKQFPPPGLDPGDSWFATKAPPEAVGTRRYVGLMAPGASHSTLMIRTYSALLQGAMTAGPPEVVDPYWSLVGYFNSLRVLGAARMQVQDDVQDRLEYLAGSEEVRGVGEPIELTSRVDSTDIPEYLARMAAGVGEEGVADVILATNMISVGVDVDRLGLMVLMGQPQAAAEYIQATSRVGRKHPGLVFALFNASRSRDRSHYEGFRGFHGSMYRAVEATSVTPFSPRARDRALHAVFVGLARLTIEGLKDDPTAAAAHRRELEALGQVIVDRVKSIDPEQAEDTRDDVDELINHWINRADVNSDLVYESTRGTEPALLTASSPESEGGDAWATMWSLRDVDSTSNLFFAKMR